MAGKQGGVSDEAVRKATGRDWGEWCALLDAAGAADWNHKKIVAHLRDAHGLSSWWQQSVTVGYEKARQRRLLGQTAAADFQLSVQATLPGSVEEAWRVLASPEGLRCWLAPAGRFTLTEGKQYTTKEGARGEIRVVKPNARARLSWHPPGLDKPVILEIALAARPSGKTSVRLQLERLPSAACREEMRTRWKEVLARLTALANRCPCHQSHPGRAGRPCRQASHPLSPPLRAALTP